MRSLYACTIRTMDGVTLTDIRLGKNFLDIVEGIENELGIKTMEVHMAIISVLKDDEQPDMMMRNDAMKWINKHIDR